MNLEELTKTIGEFLNISNFTQSGKKQALKNLLVKLKKKRVKVLRELKKELIFENEKRLKEELQLISLHITKAKTKLNSL